MSTWLGPTQAEAALNFDQLLLQAFRLEMRYQGVDERAEFAFHHFRELVQRQADAMIGNAVLRGIVGANFFRAIACLDLPKSLGVRTIPAPKWPCQMRLTITLAVSGL